MKVCFIRNGCINHDNFKCLKENCIRQFKVVNNPCIADVIIEYFCAQTVAKINDLVEELAFIKKVKSKGSIYILCGCIIDALGKEFFSSLDMIDYVFGRKEISQIADILQMTYLSNNLFYIDKRFNNVISIQDGCKNKCAFCKTNYMDFQLKSKSIEEILENAKEITKKGIRSISLTGLNTTQYGVDLYGKKMLHVLLKKISQIDALKIIDLYSVAIQDLTEEIIEEIASNDKINLVELAIQSGSNKILKAMNVRFTAEYAESVIQRLSHKQLKTAIIFGFPGENRNDFEQSIDFIKRNNLWRIQCIPYVDTPGTPSYELSNKKDSEARVKSANKTVMKMCENQLSAMIGKKVEGFITNGYEDTSSYLIIVQPKNFYGEIRLMISKDLFDFSKVEKYDSVICKISGVLDLDNAILGAEEMEAIE